MNQDISVETELAVGTMTHPGRGRAVNEDSLGLPEGIPRATLARKGHLYIVADGVGGYQAGDVASQMAVEIIRRTYYQDSDFDIVASLQRAIAAANAEIYRQAQQPAYTQMGATVVAAVVRGDELIVANAGDSRAYLLRGDTLQQLTSDHTWVAERVAAGLLTPEEAVRHDMRHIVTRSLGAEPTVEVDVRSHRLLPGDRLLLCSDGVWEPVAETEKARLLGHGRPQAAAVTLVNHAIAAGGGDDATALVVEARLARAGVLGQMGQVAESIMASPQQRMVLGGIGAVVILALLCGLGWRLVGGMQTVAPPSPTVHPTVTPKPTPQVMLTTAMPTSIPTATPEPSTGPTETPTPIPSHTPAPSPTMSRIFCVTEQYVGRISQPANALEQPSLAVYKPILTIPVNTLPAPLDDAYPDEIVRGCADHNRPCHINPFVKVVYRGQTVWILQWRLGTWQEDRCVRYIP